MDLTKHFFFIISLICWVIVVPQSSIADDSKEILKRAVTSHKTSRELISTCYCQIDFQTQVSDLKPQYSVGEYWHSMDACRLKVDDDGKINDFIWKDSVCTTLLTDRSASKTLYSGHRTAISTRYSHRADAWIAGLLVVQIPGSLHAYPFEEIINLSTKVESISSSKSASNELITVQLLFEKSEKLSDTTRLEIVFDSSVNYLIRRITKFIGSSIQENDYCFVQEVKEFIEPVKGIFFPSVIMGKVGYNTDLNQGTQSVKLSKVQVNRPLLRSIFQHQFPHGIYMTDGIKNTSYRIDSKGNPISSESKLGDHPPPPASNSYDSDQSTRQTEIEVTSYTRLYIILLSLIFVVFAIFIHYRIRKSA